MSYCGGGKGVINHHHHHMKLKCMSFRFSKKSYLSMSHQDFLFGLKDISSCLFWDSFGGDFAFATGSVAGVIHVYQDPASFRVR